MKELEPWEGEGHLLRFRESEGKREKTVGSNRVGSGGSEAFNVDYSFSDKSDYIRDPEKMRS